MRIYCPDQIVAALERHTRVRSQGVLEAAAELTRLEGSLRALVPFAEQTYAGVVSILDWDHCLPSKTLFIRLYAYYSAESLDDGLASLDERRAEITARDKFPEFDIPDYSGLFADESYIVEVEPSGVVKEARLISEWRRNVAAGSAEKAVSLARVSVPYRQIVERCYAAGKPLLSDLEAMAWVPPCTSGLPAWAIDVWVLTSFENGIGQGKSLVVDLESGGVGAVRDFSVRAG